MTNLTPAASQARINLHGGWEKARRQAEIDRLLDAGPLSTAIRIGTNHGGKSRSKAAGRLRLDRVTAAAIFPVHALVRLFKMARQHEEPASLPVLQRLTSQCP